MKSEEVYKLLKSEVDPWFKVAGFKRAKSLLSYYRAHGNEYIVVWFQVSQDGWDQFAGSKFIIEFQKSEAPTVGSGRLRKRISSLCSIQEKEEIRSIQNRVINSLQTPPESHFAFHVSPQVTEWYKKKFLPDSIPYKENQDIWFRYSKPEHVLNWGQFLVTKLSDCISIIEHVPSSPLNP